MKNDVVIYGFWHIPTQKLETPISVTCLIPGVGPLGWWKTRQTHTVTLDMAQIVQGAEASPSASESISILCSESSNSTDGLKCAIQVFPEGEGVQTSYYIAPKPVLVVHSNVV